LKVDGTVVRCVSPCKTISLSHTHTHTDTRKTHRRNQHKQPPHTHTHTQRHTHPHQHTPPPPPHTHTHTPALAQLSPLPGRKLSVASRAWRPLVRAVGGGGVVVAMCPAGDV